MSGFTPQKIRSIIAKASPALAFKPEVAPQLSAPKPSKPAAVPAPKMGRPNGALVGSAANRAMTSGYKRGK